MAQESRKAQERAVKAQPVTDDERTVIDLLRPRFRGECKDGPRPCPWYSCQFHLGADVTEDGRLILHTDPDRLTEFTATCALDVADKGEHTLDTVATLIGWSRERARQIEEGAVRKLKHPSRANVVNAALDCRPASKGNPWDGTDPIGHE